MRALLESSARVYTALPDPQDSFDLHSRKHARFRSTARACSSPCRW